MRTVCWAVLGLFSALLASAQEAERCSAPPEHPHTRLLEKFSRRESFSSGEKVYFSCAEDFTPSRGSRSVECLQGTWTKLTLKCEKRLCGNAGDLMNGHFHYEENSFIGSRVYATCNEGYTLKGLNYLICKKSGWTGEVPRCEEGVATCPSPAVDHSVKPGGIVSVHQVGDKVNFTCSQGFQLSGAPQVTCVPGGRWQPELPRCLPSTARPDQSSRKESGCGKPLNVKGSNANLADNYITMTTFASGDRVQYKCDVGHVQSGGSRQRRCRNGKWTPLSLRCQLKLCGTAGEIENGQFTYTGVEFGDTATAVCDQGFNLVGRATRRCMNKGWDGRIPVCEAVVCEEPPETTNAEREFQEPPYKFMRVIHYQCREGTLVGASDIWCTEDGTWSASPPECKVLTCPSPNVSSAYWTRAQNLFEYRETISIRCNTGYTMIGPSTITCGQNGQWSPALPQCRLECK